MLRNIKAGIPLEVQWNDIDYMADNNSNFRDFTLGKSYTKLPQLVEQIHKRNMKFIMNISPGLSAIEPKGTYEPFETALKKKLLIMDSKTGGPMIGMVWQNKTAWIDFSLPKAVRKVILT